jgi:hypothetical protein
VVAPRPARRPAGKARGGVDELYERLKTRQLEAAQAALAGTTLDRPGIEFTAHPYNPFYGGREFGIRDLNGYELWFRQNQ